MFRVFGSVALCLAAAAANAAPAPEFDLLIANGRIVDGTGSPWFRGEVGVRGDRIVAVGHLSRVSAKRRIDAGGKVVAPGFIDMLGQSEIAALIDPRLESKVRQGITTEVTGEGGSAAPVYAQWIEDAKPFLDRMKLRVDWTDLASYWRRLRKARPAINLASFVGAAQVRAYVMGEGNVDPTPAQLARMEAEVDKAMRQGALGVSSSLIYPPGSYAKTAELIALARVAARYGGIYATHIRGEADGVLEALEEAIAIGREAKIQVQIWHLKVSRQRNWGRMKEVVARIRTARTEGIDVAADVYPYTASANALMADVPEWAQDGGLEAMLGRIREADTRRRILEELRALHEQSPPSTVQVVSIEKPELKQFEGKRLDVVAKELQMTPQEALLYLVAEARGLVGVARFGMSEDDLREAMRQPWTAFNCDASGQAIDGPFARDRSHPRAFGSMPRVLGRYVREEKLLSLEDAVRKMTSLPAQRVRLLDRGVLRAGMAADIVIFDPDTIRDVATYEEPLRDSEGITHVIVNGQLVLDEGKMTGRHGGRPLFPYAGR